MARSRLEYRMRTVRWE